MPRPCLICDDGYNPHFRVISGQKIEDFASLPELVVALLQSETTHALEILADNYEDVEAKQQDNGWEKFCAMSSRDAIDYLIGLLPEIVDTFDWLFRDNQYYQQTTKPDIDHIVCRFAFQVQTLDEQYGVRYSKTESCPIWLLPSNPVRHLYKATDYTMKWSDGSRISVISGKTYPRFRDHTNHHPDGLKVEVHRIGANAEADRKYADEIRAHLDYSAQGRSLNRVYNPPVLDSFTGAIAEWVKHNTTLGIDFWHQQIEIYQQAFLPVLDELIAADDRLRETEDKPILAERYGKAKLDYALARLKAEVLLDSYQTYFRRIEHETNHIINGYDYYPRFIGDGLYYSGYRSGDDNQAPRSEYDDRPFCEYLDAFDQHVLFSKVRRPVDGILYDVCFGFKADHSGFQLILPNCSKAMEYHFYDWSDYEDLSVCGTEQIRIYNAILVSEYSPYMAKDCLPAGLQARLDQFKDFRL